MADWILGSGSTQIREAFQNLAPLPLFSWNWLRYGVNTDLFKPLCIALPIDKSMKLEKKIATKFPSHLIALKIGQIMNIDNS